MNTQSPTWELAAKRCEYCEGGEFIFSKCPSCNVPALVCAECGTCYDISIKRKGSEIGDISGNTKCFFCAANYQNDFVNMTAEEIQSLGFTPAEYK